FSSSPSTRISLSEKRFWSFMTSWTSFEYMNAFDAPPPQKRRAPTPVSATRATPILARVTAGWTWSTSPCTAALFLQLSFDEPLKACESLSESKDFHSYSMSMEGGTEGFRPKRGKKSRSPEARSDWNRLPDDTDIYDHPSFFRIAHDQPKGGS